MLNLIPAALIMCFSVSVNGQQEDFRLTDRAYVFLEKQNLVTLGSVLGVLLLLMIIMAVCVYKPLSRRWKVGIKHPETKTCSPAGVPDPGDYTTMAVPDWAVPPTCQQASLKTPSLNWCCLSNEIRLFSVLLYVWKCFLWYINVAVQLDAIIS